MPYLRITCPDRPADARRAVARRLTDAVNDVFFNTRARATREELREHTTVHVAPYGKSDPSVGGRTPLARHGIGVTVELSDWSMSVRRQRGVTRILAPALAELLRLPPTASMPAFIPRTALP